MLSPQPRCVLCDLHLGCSNPGLPSEFVTESLSSPFSPALFCISQNPGLSEDSQNRAFSDRRGELIRQVYLGSLLPLCSIYLSNLARCATASKTAIKDRYYRACLPFTLSDFRSVLLFHPRTFVLCLGSPATVHFYKAITGLETSQKEAFALNGSVLIDPVTSRPLTFFATYHPSAIARSPTLLHPVSDHISMLARTISGEITPITQPSFVSPRSFIP